MTYEVGQIIKTVYGSVEILKVNKESILISDGRGGTIKVLKRHTWS